MAEHCNCGGHGHAHGEGCGCGGHHHEHAHAHGECGCGCGGHHHEHGHAHGECGEGCGCGGHHHEHAHDDFDAPEKQITNAPATPEQRNFLESFEKIAPLPIVKYLVKSSTEHSFESVALRDVCLRSAEDSIACIKETAAFLQGLEASNLIAIDYDTQLPEECYAHYATSDSYALFAQTVAEGAENEGFLGDIATLEKGCIAMTAWGKEELAR